MQTQNVKLERLDIPPYSLEAEQAVLGGVMLDNSSWEQVVNRLREEDFYRHNHRLIFRTIFELANGNMPFDAITLSEWMQSRNQLELVGGLAYLATLARDTPTAANVSAYADIVSERSKLRRLISTGRELADAAVRPSGRTAAALINEFGDRLHAMKAAPMQPLVTICLADVIAERIEWLWPGRFPMGKVSLLVGDPGLGKSMLTLMLASTVSRGAPWPIPEEGSAPLGDVLLVSAEDAPGDTIRPRLEAVGADLTRVHIVDIVREVGVDGKRVMRSWTMADSEMLGEKLATLHECKLLVIDPISEFMGSVDSHINSNVRELLAPLSSLAAKRDMAVVCVSHLNKSTAPAMYRTSGSLAFVAAARAVFAVTRDKDNPARRLMVPIKANLAPDATGLAYTVTTKDTSHGCQPVISWETKPITVSAEEALSLPQRSKDEVGERQKASDWLDNLLTSGPKPARDIQALARDAGFAWRTVRRAKDGLGIKPEKTEFGGGWTWALPTKVANQTDDVHYKTVDILDDAGHLRQEQEGRASEI